MSVAHPKLLTTDLTGVHVCYRCGKLILAGAEHIQAIDLRFHPECAQQKVEVERK